MGPWSVRDLIGVRVDVLPSGRPIKGEIVGVLWCVNRMALMLTIEDDRRRPWEVIVDAVELEPLFDEVLLYPV